MLQNIDNVIKYGIESFTKQITI